MNSERLSRLKVLSTERLTLKRRVEEIKLEETELVDGCTHSYDDGSNALKPVAGKSGMAHTIYCVICNRFVRIGVLLNDHTQNRY